MQSEILKFALKHGMRATRRVADRVLHCLPEEPREKIKSAGISLVEIVHDLSGDILESEKPGGAGENKQTSINIE